MEKLLIINSAGLEESSIGNGALIYCVGRCKIEVSCGATCPLKKTRLAAIERDSWG